MAEWTVLPSSIMQRLTAEPTMLAVLMASGIGATAIGASVQDKDEPAPPPAAEDGQLAVEAVVEAPAQPVLLDPALQPAGALVEPAEGPSVTVAREGTVSAPASAAAKVVAQPVSATVLGPYVALPSVEPVPAPAVVAEAAPPVAELVEALPASVEPQPEPAPRMTLEVPVAAERVESATIAEPAMDTGAELAVTGVPDPIEAEAQAVEAKQPVEQAAASAPVLELAAEQVIDPAEIEQPVMEELAAVTPIAAPVAETNAASIDDAAIDLAIAEPSRAVERTGPSNAFALVFADLVEPAVAPLAAAAPALAEPTPVAAPVVGVAELAPAPAPVPQIANMAFDLSAMPQAPLPAEPGSAFVRGEGTNSVGQVGRTAVREAPGNRYRLTGNGIEFRIPAVLFGEELGTVPLRIGSTNLVSVRLGDLLALVADMMDPAAYARLAGSRQADEYVPFSTLRDAGIDLRYDAANDRLILGE